jgi:hypothetical protein
MFIFVVPTLQKKWNEIRMKELAGRKCMENDSFLRTLKFEMPQSSLEESIGLPATKLVGDTSTGQSVGDTSIRQSIEDNPTGQSVGDTSLGQSMGAIEVSTEASTEDPNSQEVSEATNDSQNLPRQRHLRFKTMNQLLQNTIRLPDYPREVLSDAYLATIGESMYEPQTLQEAMTSSATHHWKEAIRRELQALHDNQTWKLVPLPKGCKPTHNKWVFKIKYIATREIEKYKARLVAKGFTQKQGVDFSETYAPIIRHDSI